MTENEAIEVLKEIVDEIAEDDGICYVTDCDKEPLEMAMSALSEIQQYRAIGTVEDIQMIFQLCKDLQVMCGKYHEIGTIEEFKAYKQGNCTNDCKHYDSAIEYVRKKAIDEFAHQFKENLNQEFPSNYESTRPYFSLENARLIVDEIAEQMKAGGIDG